MDCRAKVHNNFDFTRFRRPYLPPRGLLLASAAQKIAAVEPQVPAIEEERQREHEQAKATQQPLPPPTGPKQTADDDGKDEEPMRAHDVDLVQSEAQHQVDERVEAEKRQRQPHEPGATACPYARKEQPDDDGFYAVVQRRTVGDDGGTAPQHVAEQVVGMEHERFAKPVLDDGGQAGRRNVGPLRKLALGDGLSLPLTAVESVGGSLPSVFLPLRQLPQGGHDGDRIAQPGGVAKLCEEPLPALFGLLPAGFLAGLETWFLEVVPLPTGRAPQQQRGQEHGGQQVGRAEQTPPVGEEGGQKHLYAVVERDAGRQKEQHDGLQAGQRPPMLHLQAGHIERQQEHEHGKGEVVGHARRHHHHGETEAKRREQHAVGTPQADQLAQNAVEEQAAVDTTERQQRADDKLHAVEAGQMDAHLVDLIGQIHEEGQQRMAVYIIRCGPTGDHFVGERVETGDVERADEEPMIGVAQLGEGTGIAPYDHRVERQAIEQGTQGEPTLVGAHPKEPQPCFHRCKNTQ